MILSLTPKGKSHARESVDAIGVFDYEGVRVLFELQSLAFTIPLVVLCFLVCKQSSLVAMTLRRGTQQWWLLTGVMLGFAGRLLDSIYWMIPWTANYLQWDFVRDVQDFGVFPNIVFRQGLTIASAYCYLRAFIPEDKIRLVACVKGAIIGSIVVGQVYIFCLSQIKKHHHEKGTIDIHKVIEEQGHSHVHTWNPDL